MNFTVEVLADVLPYAPLPWLKEVVRQLPLAGFTTPEKVASFIAQVAHESREFTHLEENLNYSAERMTQVWPRRFKTPEPEVESAIPYESALPYAHNPELLANYVYANIIGNGDELSGDGWRYRGRGPIQLTGKCNYSACEESTGLPLINAPDILLEPEYGIQSALWYWEVNKLGRFDTDKDVRLETRAINRGELGLAQRQSYFDRCYAELIA